MVTVVKSLRDGLAAAFAEDERVHLLGEDVLDPYGGAFKVTLGLSDRFPDRVHTTPISEGAIVGAGVGLALRNKLPVVELMFGDFLTLTVDQLISNAAKFQAMFGGTATVPLVVRAPMGGGRGYGPTHSQTLEKIVLGTPHLRVMAPSIFHDAGQMIKDAVLDEKGPILFVENKTMYPETQITENQGGLIVESHGSTQVVRNYQTGSPDVTAVCYGGMSLPLAHVMQRLAAEEIRVEAIVPGLVSTIPTGLIVQSVQDSHRVVVLDEATEGFGWASEVAAQVNQACFGVLAAPVRRLAAKSTVIPTAKNLESAVLPSEALIESALLEIL